MKVIFADLSRKSRGSKKNVRTERVRDANGKIMSVKIVDLGSKTLSSDLTYVFRQNVGRALSHNKHLGTIQGARRRA